MLCPIHVSWPGLDSRGSGLADVFAELDMTSELLRIQISPDKPWFRLTTDGNAGTSQVDCPKDSDVIETFTCSQISVNDYNLKLIKPSEKALGLSDKISIRMNSWGVLSTQVGAVPVLCPCRDSAVHLLSCLCRSCFCDRAVTVSLCPCCTRAIYPCCDRAVTVR